MPQIKKLIPYGFKSLDLMTPPEIESVGQALYAGSHLERMRKYVNDTKSEVIDFNTLNRVDAVFTNLFEKGQDITPIVSIVDWSQFTFSSHRLFQKLFERDKFYNHSQACGTFHVNNMEILWRNFLLYRSDDDNYRREQNHIALQDFGLHMVSTYAYTFHPRHTLQLHEIKGPDTPKNRQTSLVRKRKKIIGLFKEIFSENEIYYDALEDPSYFARVCMEMTAKALSYSQGLIAPTDPLFTTFYPVVKAHFPYLWKDLHFVVSSHLFKENLIQTPALNYFEELVSTVEPKEFAKNLKSNFISYQNLENNALIYHFLFKSWKYLENEDFNVIFSNICLRLDPEKRQLWEMAFQTVEPIEEALVIFKKHAYHNKKIDTPLFKQTIEILESRRFSIHLDKTLDEKEIKNKIIKI